MTNKLDDLNKSRNLIFANFLLLTCFVFQQCGILKPEENQFGEYALIGNNDALIKIYEVDSFNFKRVRNLFVVTSKFIGTNKKDIYLDYKFQIDEQCHDFIRKDSVKYNVTKVSTKSFNVNGDDHLVYKFYYDEYASSDEEDLILVHQDLGIIFIHQYWGERIDLKYHPKLSQVELNTLKKMIQADQIFYKTWNSCIWN